MEQFSPHATLSAISPGLCSLLPTRKVQHMRFESLLLPGFALLVFACGGAKSGAESSDVAVTDSLTVVDESSEDAGDWKAIFDGKSFSGWHKYGGGTVGEAWKIETDGSFRLDPSKKTDGAIVGGGDIVTDLAYQDYELELDWKIGACGNSGIIYNVLEEPELQYPWLTGPEMQVLDDSCHPDAKIYKHKAGDLYDMISGDSLIVKPAGEWNTVRLVNQAGHVEHWVNGTKVVEYDNTGAGWAAMIAASKFKEMPRFGSSTSGKIALQDHGDEVHYRNVRIRQL